MYLKHFNLARAPFDQLPDPEFLFLTEQHTEALARMSLALAINDSFTIVTGEVGSGKTTLVRKLLSDIDDNCVVAFVTHTKLTASELLQLILVEFGVRPFAMGKIELITELRRFIERQQAQGVRVVIVVDEAQNLGMDVLEELRLLTCLDDAERKALNIVLLGQPQLSRILQSPDLDQLRQRCRLQFHLKGLSRQETGEYMRHRLRIARGGEDAELFDDSAVSAVYWHTRGIPRLINTLCDTALMMAAVAERPTVATDSVEEAIGELGWSGMTTTPRAAASDDAAADASAMLIVWRGGELIARVALGQDSYVIGRGAGCSIRIRSRYLSRHHALLSFEGGRWFVTDLRSTNGVSVNGRKVRASLLNDGDMIEIGKHQLVFTLSAETADARLMHGAESIHAADDSVLIEDDDVAEGHGR